MLSGGCLGRHRVPVSARDRPGVPDGPSGMSGTLLDPLPAGYPTQQPAPSPRQSPDQDQDPAPARPATLYGCFSCAWCYLASQRSDLAGPAAGHDWRMVVPSRHLPVTGVRFDAAGRQHLQDDSTTIRALLQPGEVLPADAPGFLQNTGPAVAGSRRPTVPASPARYAGCCSTPTGPAGPTSATRKSCGVCLLARSGPVIPPACRFVTPGTPSAWPAGRSPPRPTTMSGTGTRTGNWQQAAPSRRWSPLAT